MGRIELCIIKYFLVFLILVISGIFIVLIFLMFLIVVDCDMLNFCMILEIVKWEWLLIYCIIVLICLIFFILVF